MNIMRMNVVIVLLVASSAAFSQDGMLSVTGFGTVDPGAFATKSQGRMMALRAAQVDAQRQLAENIKGVELTGGTTVEEYEVTSDLIATRVRGLIRGAFVLEKEVNEEANTLVAEVQMAICLDNRADVCKERETLQNIIDKVQ